MIPFSTLHSRASRGLARRLRGALLFGVLVCVLQAAGPGGGIALATVTARNVSTFRDCPGCSLMIILPTGRFVMGSPADETGRLPDEGPPHAVVIDRPFAIGVYDVTRAEYARFVDATGYAPVGANADANRANTGEDECCGPKAGGADRWLYTSPVGSFPANDFGLFDMIGNVWQWTADCATADYATPALPPNSPCASHMVRGGGWFHPPAVARSASRAADDNDQRVADIGFRVARSL